MKFSAIRSGDCICTEALLAVGILSSHLIAPRCGITTSNASAKLAALAVDRKFTASLFSRLCSSNVAPSRLSKSNPNTAPAQLTQSSSQLPRNAQVPAPAVRPAAITPATVPMVLTAPSRPGSTVRRVVIMRGRPPSTCPISDETVSAAASARAASPSANSAPFK